ncbi:hypothetical protein CLAIMM_02911 [Cladophialophora immunda]|nr:hypothetical protein CLAIMM_02911 [Cladophialophora immunda]
MARKRRQWSVEETKGLYKALDESVNEGANTFAQSVEKIKQHLLTILKKGNSQLSEKQVKTKLHGLGKKVGVSGEKLVSEWDRHRRQFVARSHHQQSASPPPGTSSLHGSNSVPPQDPEQQSVDPLSPVASNAPAPATDNPPSSSSSSSGSLSYDAASNAAHEIDNSSPKPFNRVLALLSRVKLPGYESFDDILNTAWSISGEARRWGDGPSNIDSFRSFAGITLDIEHGIDAFCKAFPIAHLTSSNLTRASLRLGRTLCLLWDRTSVDSTLNSLLADPFMSTQVILRAFAGAAIFEWVFVDADSPFSLSCPTAIPKPMSGNLLEFCEEYLPVFAASMETEEKLSYLDLVIKPMIPGLARQFAKDLFDALVSLCVSPAPPANLMQWEHPTHEAQAANAFLAALKFSLIIRRAKPGLEFQLQYPKIGACFDHETMTSADRRSNGSKLSQDNKVALALCPIIWENYGLPHNRKRHCLHKALVMVEGLGIDETTQGYPGIVDLP